MSFKLGTIDAGGDGRAVLLESINYTYNTSFTLDDFDFVDVERVITPNPTHNSKIKLGPKAHTGYYGFRTVYYNRIHVSELGPIRVSYDNENYLTQLLDKINNKYGVMIKASDIYEKILTAPTPPETEISIELEFRPESIIFYGGDIITAGNNDPSIEFDSPINLPFGVDTAFFVNSKYEVENGFYVELSSVALATDYERQRTTRIINNNDIEFNKINKNVLTQEQYNKHEKQLPFVFTWNMNHSKRNRGLTMFGDVLELSANGEEWTYVSNVDNLENNASSTLIDQYKNNIVFKKGIQASDGKLYLLKKNITENTVELLVSDNLGSGWNKLTINEGNQQFDKVDTEILDMVSSNNKIYFIVRSNTPYPSTPNKGIKTPSVEIYNLKNNNTEYYPLGDMVLKNTSLKLDSIPESIFRFFGTQEESFDKVKVVALTNLERTKTPVIVIFKQTDAGFEAELLNNTNLEPTTLTNGFYDIGAFTKKFHRNTNEIDIVYLTGRIVSDEIDIEHFLNTKERPNSKFFKLGLNVFTRVRENNQSTTWNKVVTDLDIGTIPRVITLDQYGKRNIMVFQGEVGLFTVDFRENDLGEIIPLPQILYKSGSQTGYNLHSNIVTGQINKIKLQEYPQASPTFNEYSNEEVAKDDIIYSFIIKEDNDYKWLVATDINTNLIERSISSEYGDITTPVVVASMENKLYAWIDKVNTVFESENAGRSWKPYSRVYMYYDDYHKVYTGTSQLSILPHFFKKGSFKNNKLLFELHVKTEFDAYKKETLDFNSPVTCYDEVIYEVTNTESDKLKVFNSVYSSRGLNVLSKYSPRKIITWDTDTNNDLFVLSKYSVDREHKYNKKINYDQLHADIVDEVIFLDYDLKFVGINYLALVKTELGIYKLIVIKESNSTIYDFSLEDSPFKDFKPVDKWYLWDYKDEEDSYIPFIILGNKELLLVERVNTEGNYSFTRHTLSIPNDNNSGLKIVPMLSDNRKDYLLYQKNNGVFRLTYQWDKIERISTLGLERIFDIGDYDLITGTQLNGGVQEPYNEVVVPVIPAYGTVLGHKCIGVDKYNIIADGKLGTIEILKEKNSLECGYVPPVPGNIEDGGSNVNTGP